MLARACAVPGVLAGSQGRWGILGLGSGLCCTCRLSGGRQGCVTDCGESRVELRAGSQGGRGQAGRAPHADSGEPHVPVGRAVHADLVGKGASG